MVLPTADFKNIAPPEAERATKQREVRNPQTPGGYLKYAIVWLGILAMNTTFADPAPPLWNWLTDDFEVLMHTHGQISFAPYVNGGSPRNQGVPGYRSDFYAYVDFFQWKGFISNWLIANSTVIDRSDSNMFRLDRIRYTLTPGYRYEFKTWIISGLFLHECIHSIGRVDSLGSVWWNSIQFGFGSKGSYQQFLVERYRNPFGRIWENWDYQINGGAFLYGHKSVWLAQNQDYRYQEFSLLRYHLGRWGKWGSYADLNQALWVRATGDVEQKWTGTVNLLLMGADNIAALYYTYNFYDTNALDNEDKLGAFGFKIVF